MSCLQLAVLRQFNLLFFQCVTDLDDQSYEYDSGVNTDDHSNAITESYATSNESESQTNSKSKYMFSFVFIIII